MSIYVTSPVDNNHVDESTNDYSNEKDNPRVEDNRDKEDQQQSNKQGIKRKYIRILLGEVFSLSHIKIIVIFYHIMDSFPWI